MRLKNYDASEPRKAVTKEFAIVVNASEEEAPVYIYGPDKVRLDRYANYYLALEGQEDTPLNAQISITEDSMAKNPPSDYGTLQASAQQQHVYVLHANNKNKLGKLTLEANYNGKACSKVVEIIPLW